MSGERVAQTEERQDDLFGGAGKVEAPRVAEELLGLFVEGKWNGDMDAAPIRMTQATRDEVKASGESCVGWRCGYYANCPFYTERRRLQTAKIIVANQDLVLSDLRLALEEDAAPIFPVQRYLLVVDEAHRYFQERAMPDAMLKLKQMVGRLLRSETDRGRITVLDPRLASTRWGRQMLDSLPPFRVEEETVDLVS